ncbi:hypothetical protein OROHE_020770 [Orobanche hederae]
MLFIVFSFAWWVLVGDSRHCNIRLELGCYNQMVGICAYFYYFILGFWCTIFVSKRLFHNLTNFYHNAPTRDIRLFMKSFSNERSPNEPYEFLPQCSYR